MVNWYQAISVLQSWLYMTWQEELRWDETLIRRYQGREVWKLACRCSSTCESCWSSLCLFILAAVVYFCSRYGTIVGSFHTGGYSTCSLLKKTAVSTLQLFAQRHPRWICLSSRRYNCCQSACMTLWMSLGSHVSKQSFQHSTFCG